MYMQYVKLAAISMICVSATITLVNSHSYDQHAIYYLAIYVVCIVHGGSYLIHFGPI